MDSNEDLNELRVAAGSLEFLAGRKAIFLMRIGFGVRSSALAANSAVEATRRSRPIGGDGVELGISLDLPLVAAADEFDSCPEDFAGRR